MTRIKALIKFIVKFISFPSKLLPSRLLRKMNSDQRRFFNLIVTGIIIVFGTWTISSLLAPDKSDAAWFNDSWLYRQTVPIANAGTGLSNAQFPITLDTATLITAGKSKSDCSDIRVTSLDGAILKHWVHECNTATSKIYTFSDIPAGSSSFLIYYGNPSAQDTEVTTGNTQYPGISCKTILDHGDGASNQQYVIDPNAGSTTDAFSAYCDMTTDSGGWTIVTSQNGTINQQGLTSNTEVAGDPFSNASHNISTQKKQDLSLLSSESLIKRSTGVWLKADDPLFDGNLTTASQHPHYSPITLTANNGIQVTTAVMGYSNYNNASGGDFGITTSVGFDHHNTAIYYHLNSGCGNHYLYKYGTTYNVNTALGSWTQTTACSSNSTAMGAWFAAMRGAITPTVTNLTISSPTNEEKSEGPIAYWSMDEGSGNTVNDNTKNGNNGTISGATWQEESMCLEGKCLYFDGTNDQVTFGDINNVPLTGDLTISFWIKPTNLTKGRQNPIGKAYGGEFNFTLETTGSLSYYHGSAGGDASPFKQFNPTSNGLMSNNSWTHVVLTRDRDTRTLNYYINGRLDSTTTWTDTVDPSDSTRLLRFGYEYAGFFQGYLDEVKLYASTKSVTQIQQEYNSGFVAVLGAKDANLNNGLLAYYKMDEASGTSVSDSSGGNKTATAVDLDAVNVDTDTPPPVSSAKFGNGRTIDGVDDTVQVGQLGSSLTNFTIAFWAKATSLPTKDYERYFNSGDNFEIAGDTSGNIRFYDGVTWTNASSLTVAEGFKHFIFTFDGTTLKVYKNGAEVYSAARGRTIPNVNLAFGGKYSAGYQESLPSVLDEYRIYNRALPKNEVIQLYNYSPLPVAYYDFEEASGSTLYDRSGTGNNSTAFTGTPTWTTGKYGNGLQFDDNSSDGVYVAGNQTLNYQNYTLGFWAKFDSQTAGVYRQIISKTSTTTDRAPGIWFNPNGRRFHWKHYPNNYGPDQLGPLGEGTDFSAGKWHYITGVKNGTSFDVYLDGKKIGTTYTLTDPMTNDSGGNLYIGQSGYTSAGMILDEIKLYNYARTASQIIEDMNAEHPIAGSPIGSQTLLFNLDEGTGTTTNNSGNAGSALNGTISGATWSNNGKSGKALSFDGVDDYVQISDNSALDLANEWTVGGWYKPTDTVLTGSNRQSLISKWQTSSGTIINYYLEIATNGKAKISASNGTTAGNATGTTTLQAGSWYHIIGSFNGSTGELKIYVNGKLEATSNTGFTVTSINSGNVRLGQFDFAWSLYRDEYSGLMDDIKIYGATLTDDQVKIDYNAGQSLQLGAVGTDASGNPSNSSDRAYCPPGDTTATCGPVAEWQFEERQGTTTKDTSGNGNTGSFTSASQWTKGKIGSALQFSSSNPVTVTSLTGLPSSQISVAAWVKVDSHKNWHNFVNHEWVGNGWLLFSNSSGVVSFGVGQAGVQYNTIGPTISPGTWNYVVGTYDGTNVNIYVNGVKGTSAALPGATLDNIGDIYIGSNTDGAMDNVQIYNYALSTSQIAWNYNKGAPVAYYDLDECQGTTLHSFTKPYNPALDGTLNIGATGTQTSAGTCQTTGTAWGNGASGKINTSLSFDGTDDYVQVPDPSSGILDFGTSDFSINLWQYRTNNSAIRLVLGKRVFPTGYVLYYSGDSLVMQLGDGTNVASYTLGTVSNLNTWHHISVVVRRSTSQMLFYLNGNLINTINISAVSGSLSNSGYFGIGRDQSDSNSFAGKIDDVQVFNYALSPQQVKTSMNQGAIRFGP